MILEADQIKDQDFRKLSLSFYSRSDSAGVTTISIMGTGKEEVRSLGHMLIDLASQFD